MKFTAENEVELIEKTLAKIKDDLGAGFLIGLIGDLGAGKTTLVQGLLKNLGVEEPVTSPTFTLRKEYQGAKGLKIQHIDLYRHSKDVKSPEIEEWLADDQMMTFVEWPENLSDFLGSYDVIIKIKQTGEKSRSVDVLWN